MCWSRLKLRIACLVLKLLVAQMPFCRPDQRLDDIQSRETVPNNSGGDIIRLRPEIRVLSGLGLRFLNDLAAAGIGLRLFRSRGTRRRMRSCAPGASV